MVINHNMSAMYANRVAGLSYDNVQRDIEKLSSGERINRAGDDASGLAVSEKMRSQIRGLNQASQNIQNGASFIQTTEGYLQGITDVLQRVRELAVQSANGIYSDEDRGMIQVEVDQLMAEIDRISDNAEFNGKKMLTGQYASEDAGVQIQIGANMDQYVKIAVAKMDTVELFGDEQGEGSAPIDLKSVEGANAALGAVDEALKKVNTQRANLGAYQNRFEKALASVNNAAENLQASESRIRDTNMANLMVEYVKNQILVQSGTAMLAQANTRSQNVLSLLR